MKKSYLFLSAVLFSLLLLSCTRDDDRVSSLGITRQEVTISASFPEVNVPTKTQTNAEGVRVFWSAHENIKIFSSVDPGGIKFTSTNDEPIHAANFKGTIGVVTSTATDAASYSTVFGLYPYRADATYSVDAENDVVRINTFLSNAQTGKANTFADSTLITVGSSKTFSMGFKHVCTGLKIKVTKEGIRKIILSSNNGESLTGRFNIVFTGSTPSVDRESITEGQSSVTLTAPDNGTFALDTWYYIVTLPVTFSGGFTLTAYTDNTHDSFSYTGSATLSAGTFGIKDNLGDGLFEFAEPVTFSEDDLTAGVEGMSKSLVIYSVQSGTSNAAPWMATSYSTDGGSTWSSSAPDWLSLSQGNGSGGYLGDVITVNVQSTETVTEVVGTDTGDLKIKGSVGSFDAPRDLSVYDINENKHGTGSASDAETANCYVVKSPGYYMFPLVYGNAIKGGSANKQAYAPTTAAKSTTYLTPFENSKGLGIGSPYILEDIDITSTANLDAVVAWQDVAQGFEIVLDDDIDIVDASDVTGAALKCNYIRFYVSPQRIKSGNVVIALRDVSDSSNPVVLWSWHIWVTAQTFSTVTLENNADTEPTSVTLLNLPLGWTQPLSFASASVDRSCKVKVVSLYGEKVFTVTQSGTGTGVVEGGSAYSSTFYQWGRKDPILPAKGGNNTDKVFSTNYPELGFNKTSLADIAATIKAPGTHSTSNFSQMYNLWDADNTAANVHSTVVKTIYDPCPRGYSVNPMKTYSKLNTSNCTYVSDANSATYNWAYAGRKYENLFMPFAGTRPSNGNITNVTYASHYWSTTGTTVWGYYFLFSNTDVSSNDYSGGRNWSMCVRPAVNN